MDDIIEYLERLALISFTEDEKGKLFSEIEKIIQMFNALMDIEGLDQYEPLYHVHDIPLSLRGDEFLEGIDEGREILKDNAILLNGYVKAPKTLSE